MFGKVVLRNKSERGKNEWRSSFQNRKSLWEQKSVSGEMCPDETSSVKVRPHSVSTDKVSFMFKNILFCRKKLVTEKVSDTI